MALSVDDLLQLILTNLPDNTSEYITPELLRDTLNNIVNSVYTKIDDREIIGLSEWDNTKGYILNECAVFDGDIYQCLVPNSTIGTFVGAEWQIISTYIASTAGLDIYAEKQHVIELDDNKRIKSIATDSSLTSITSGIFLIEANSISVGLTEEYPILGKSMLFSLRRISTSESIFICYPLTDLTKYYIKKLNGDWTEFKSAGEENNYINGITKIGNDVFIGGDYTLITLSGDSFTLTGNKIEFNGTTGIIGNLEHEGNAVIGNNTASIVVDSSVNINGTSVKLNNVPTSDLLLTQRILVIDDITKEAKLVNTAEVQAGTNFPLAENGITFETKYKLGGDLIEHTHINSDVAGVQRIDFGATRNLSWFEVYAKDDIWLQYDGLSGEFAQIILDNQGVSLATNSALPYAAKLRTDNLTTQRIFQFPDESGNLLIKEDANNHLAIDNVNRQLISYAGYPIVDWSAYQLKVNGGYLMVDWQYNLLKDGVNTTLDWLNKTLEGDWEVNTTTGNLTFPEGSGTLALESNYSSAGNGLTQVGNLINLGGTLTAPVTIDPQGYDFDIGTTTSYYGNTLRLKSFGIESSSGGSGTKIESINSVVLRSPEVNIFSSSLMKIKAGDVINIDTQHFNYSSGSGATKVFSVAGITLQTTGAPISIYSAGAGTTIKTSNNIMECVGGGINLFSFSGSVAIHSQYAPVTISAPNTGMTYTAFDNAYMYQPIGDNPYIIPHKLWVDIHMSTAGGAINGITKTGSIFKLGGDIIENTTLEFQGSYDFEFADINNFTVSGIGSTVVEFSDVATFEVTGTDGGDFVATDFVNVDFSKSSNAGDFEIGAFENLLSEAGTVDFSTGVGGDFKVRDFLNVNIENQFVGGNTSITTSDLTLDANNINLNSGNINLGQNVLVSGDSANYRIQFGDGNPINNLAGFDVFTETGAYINLQGGDASYIFLDGNNNIDIQGDNLDFNFTTDITIQASDVYLHAGTNSYNLNLKTDNLGSDRTLQFSDVDGLALTYSGGSTPATSTSAGKKGEIRSDGSYLYVCISNNVWIRSAVTTSW